MGSKKSRSADENGWITFTPDGNALLDMAGDLRSLIVEKKDKGCPKYRFDFRNVINMDPATLSVFHIFGKTFGARSAGTNLKIVNANEELERVLHGKGIDAYVEISEIPFTGRPEMQPPKITAKKEDSGAVAKIDSFTLVIPGNITRHTVDLLRPLFHEIINAGSSKCVFNLNRVNDIDLAGLHMLKIYGEKIFKKNNMKRIRVINANEDVANIFLKTGLEKFYLLNSRLAGD